jgi:hypothetical protein
VEYLDLPQEPPAIIESNRPPAYWPSSSTNDALVVVEDLVIKYAPELPSVLHGVSFTLRAKERVGLLGRTGWCRFQWCLRPLLICCVRQRKIHSGNEYFTLCTKLFSFFTTASHILFRSSRLAVAFLLMVSTFQRLVSTILDRDW